MTEWGVRYPARDDLEQVVEACADEAAARALVDRWSRTAIELVQRRSPGAPWRWVPRPGQEFPPCDRCIPDQFGEPIGVLKFGQVACEHVRRGSYQE